eukprot:TRINITY_DN3385_c0_g1_i3.p1 TRINITY_DN3385_c0_g1~~TRINITY_DN3385_c0_g1_i3.p1  ORF type:complete len:109 (+),score=7.81 TRINITY_DN3385_c0_g1_i3:315-641(+)
MQSNKERWNKEGGEKHEHTWNEANSLMQTAPSSRPAPPPSLAQTANHRCKPWCKQWSCHQHSYMTCNLEEECLTLPSASLQLYTTILPPPPTPTHTILCHLSLLRPPL